MVVWRDRKEGEKERLDTHSEGVQLLQELSEFSVFLPQGVKRPLSLTLGFF